MVNVVLLIVLFNFMLIKLNSMTNIEFASRISALNDTLRGFTYRFTRNAEESQDLVQDTVLRALIYQDKFRDNTNLKGWLFTIMRNTFINHYRKAKMAVPPLTIPRSCITSMWPIPTRSIVLKNPWSFRKYGKT